MLLRFSPAGFVFSCSLLYVRTFLESFMYPEKFLISRLSVPALLMDLSRWLPQSSFFVSHALSGVCGESYLNIGGYVGGVVSGNQTVAVMLPAMFFLVALGLAFATGTSWGTFGILIPIVLAILGTNMNLATMTVAAVLAGAVGGDRLYLRFPILQSLLPPGAVQPYRPCVYTDSLCTLCFFLLRSRLYCGRRNGRRPLGNFFRYHSADTYDGRNLQV